MEFRGYWYSTNSLAKNIMRKYKPLILPYNAQVWGGYRQNAIYAGKNSVFSSTFKFLGWIT